jgi:hypothetical protein
MIRLLATSVAPTNSVSNQSLVGVDARVDVGYS